MTAMLDLNVLLDLLQSREQHGADAATLASSALKGRFKAMIPAHALTTIFYIIAKTSGYLAAERGVDSLLAKFNVAALDHDRLRSAHRLPLLDYEDAVVATLAQVEGCDYIVTRDLRDFTGSPLPALAPADFLKLLANIREE